MSVDVTAESSTALRLLNRDSTTPPPTCPQRTFESDDSPSNQLRINLGFQAPTHERAPDACEEHIVLEAEAGVLAAERGSLIDFRIIRGGFGLCEQQRNDAIGFVDAEAAFHRAIVAAAHNTILFELFAGFTPRLR